MICVDYPCFASGEPRRMAASAIWNVAAAVRRRLAGAGAKPLDVLAIMRGTERLCVNAREMRVAWDIDHAVHDDGGPVLGVCEHDPAEPGMAMISLNTETLADRPELLRSTAAHELGHAIFDMPAAMRGGARHARVTDRPARSAPIDWREWRANEFMGALLVPAVPMRNALLRHASEAGIRPRWAAAAGGPVPVIAGPDAIDFIADELALDFGVSPAFIAVRLRKYGFVSK